MYRPTDRYQRSFLDFNQPMGLHMNSDNRWVKMADSIPWDEFEIKYAGLFPSGTGNVAKPLRMALGALIIQTKFRYSDRELVEQISENPYLQRFYGLPGYQEQAPFDASTLVLLGKRTTMEMVMEARAWTRRAMGGLRRYPLAPITRGPPCRRPWSASGSVPGSIRKGSSQTRYTGHTITAGTAKDMGYAFLAPVWGGRPL